ncbi:MAG: CRISPR-associated endonuclease Cas3'', partial [Planctomycetia bacterium]|nr:CRISPR-associated endonuclease Cas3'' [Planctomycetia bacterium]
MSTKLYAKSFDEQNGPEENILLLSHLKYSFWAAEAILDCTAPIQLKVLGIDESQYERFRRIVLLAAAIHDLGKANSLFQAAVRTGIGCQSIRHEWILFLLLRFSPLGTWIRSALESDIDFTILVWAIAGHHRKEKAEITMKSDKDAEITMKSDKDMEILFIGDDFQVCLNWVADEFKLASPPALDPELIEDGETRKILQELLTDLKKGGDDIGLSLKQKRRFEKDRLFYRCWSHEQNQHDRVLMSTVRSILMEADVVASALADPDFCTDGEILTRDKIHEWVKNSLGHLPLPDQYNKIVELRQQQIATKTVSGPKNTTLDLEREAFQNEVALSKSRVTLVTAGCGSGKTLAAFRWAQNNARPCGNRLFFGYPTTGTATEGFLDYLFDDKTIPGDLIHSRVAVDFLLNERMKNAVSSGNDGDDQTEIIKSLRLWSTGIVCCTVDTMLSFLVNMYSGHLAWSALTQSIFVFDEIHSYDETLFGYLLKFLRIARGMPILRPEDDSEDAAVDEAIARYKQGEKVLWICNTVSRAIHVAERITERCGQYRPIVYHSHFRYEDRIKRHTECVEAFRRK